MLSGRPFRAIFTVRDPRDVVVSGGYATALRAFMAEYSKDPRVAFVRYEDMWYWEDRRLGQSFAAIGSWYGIPAGQELKDFVQAAIKVGQETAAYRTPARSTLVKEDKGNRHFRKGTPGDWKNHFNWQNKAYFRTKLGNLLQELGYESDDSW
ncbi:hypothetical protein KFL_002290090 [Klebsormidium nitens]|uniref:Sulfotransferase n=1 Tax=Klebsormidium nitens TaxID=105231 RepID=A0A1Y1IB43_KLENI|nr:hypothetical protein KFL_002290090 [Klebsormidium nitens]|eukprot:GAQ85318.1 hypothetical protein KFL_002290090 [Klebsormidium nitens]